MFNFPTDLHLCPMKNVPLVLRREGEEYKHTSLPTDGEV